VLAPYFCQPTGRHQSAREPSLGRSPRWLQTIAGEVCQKTLILPCEAQIDYPRPFVVDRCTASRRCDHTSEIRCRFSKLQPHAHDAGDRALKIRNRSVPLSDPMFFTHVTENR